MHNSFIRVLLVSITLLLGVMSNVVMAQTTNFDFTTTLSESPGYGGATAAAYGSYYNSTSSSFYTLTGTFTTPSTSGGNITLTSVNYGGQAVTAFNVKSSGTYSTSNGTISSLEFTFTPSSSLGLPNNDMGALFSYNLLAAEYSAGRGVGYVAMSTVVSPGGAPEIDGSLAPKVGFLLGCLFLMFGRKKHNPEPILAS